MIKKSGGPSCVVRCAILQVNSAKEEEENSILYFAISQEVNSELLKWHTERGAL
jgi:hypothetical protein